MLLKRILKIGSASMINWLHKWAIWEVANGKILVLLFRCWKIIKLYPIKITRSNLFCPQFIEKNNWGANEKRFEKNNG